jgi:hypothetical protein
MSDPLARFWTRPNGQRVEVETVEFDPPPGKARKVKPKEFAKVELEWLAGMAEVTGCPCAVVLVVLRYLAWRADGKPFAFSNTLLSRLGIDRRIKYWVLESLEAAGKIRVERRGTRKAPMVTLL